MGMIEKFEITKKNNKERSQEMMKTMKIIEQKMMKTIEIREKPDKN